MKSLEQGLGGIPIENGINFSEVSLNDLLKEILNTKVALIGDNHEDENWIHNQKVLLEKLLDSNSLFAFEGPFELLSVYSPLVKLIPQKRRLPLLSSYELEDPQYDENIHLFLQTYSNLFNVPIIAILGYLHLDIQSKKLEVPKVVVHQSFNGKTYPGLVKGIYQLQPEKYLIKGLI